MYTLATLSDKGWVTDGRDIFDRVFAYFLASDYSQSNVYYNNISSFPYIIQESGNDITKLIQTTESTLKTYLSRYFTDVVVLVKDTTPDASGAVELTIRLSLRHNGVVLDITSIINFTLGSSNNIIHYNQYG